MRRWFAVLGLGLLLSACATAQRYDAAGDVHALLVAIRDNDQQAFDARVDRFALKAEIEQRLRKEGSKRGAGFLGELLAPVLADAAGDAFIRPDVFRAVASHYGYKRDTPIPGPIAITGSLKRLDDGRMCAVRKKDGPCLLMFTEEKGVWRLSGFEGDLSMLRTRS